MTTLALVTASVTSTGGISALIVRRIRKKKTKQSERAQHQEEQVREQATKATRRETWNI
jgi:membrane protein implicated in regulation of membrane protease activity